MGTTRSHITTKSGWQFDRATKRLGGWLTGYGLLSLNIGLFLLTATGLFLYNLYHDPRNIDVLEQLRFWALLIIFHAVAVTVFWIVSWAVRAEKPASTHTSSFDPSRSNTVPAIGSGDTYGGSRFRPTASTPVIVDDMEESEHFWRRRSTAILHRHEPGRQDTWQWSISDEAALTRTWPEQTTEDRVSPAPEIDAEPANSDDTLPTVGDHVVGVVYDPVELEQAKDEQQDEPKDSVIDPLRVAGRQPRPNTPATDEAVLTRWLWVEAAAAAWLAQREDSKLEGSDSVVPPPAAGSDAEAF
jgi:hypothetical protein